MIKHDSFEEAQLALYEMQLKAGELLLFQSAPRGVDEVQRWLDVTNLAKDYCIGVGKDMGIQGAVVVMPKGSTTPNLKFQERNPQLEGMNSKLAPPPGPPKRYGHRH